MALASRFKSAALCSVALPNVFQDPSLISMDGVNGGAQYIYDFCAVGGNPNADGALAAGAAIPNLVPGKSAASVLLAGLNSKTGKAGLSLPGALNSVLQLGAAGAFDLSPSGDEEVIHIWFKLPATGYATAGYMPFVYFGPAGVTTGTTSQWWIDLGPNGLTLRAQLGTGSGTTNAQAVLTPGTLYLLSIHIKPSTGLVEVYLNNALITSSSSGALTLQSGAGSAIYVGGKWIGTLYRLAGEDLTLSGRTAAPAIAAEYGAQQPAIRTAAGLTAFA